MGLSGVLDIAKSALLASQSALQTTSHNIANVNTPGFVRQRVNLASGEPTSIGGLYVGTGVTVTGVERVYDRFLGLQIFDAAESQGRYDGRRDALARLEGIFNDFKGAGLGDVLDGFFAALGDVANDPSSYPARTVLMGKAETLGSRLNSLASRVQQEISNVESQISGTVKEITSLASRVAEFNARIREIESGGAEANDLRDQRDSLVKSIAEKIDITVLDGEGGQVNILVAGGNSLVAGKSASTLSAVQNPENNGYYDIMLGTANLTGAVSSGRLKGLIEARDGDFRDAAERLDTLAASITREFNVIHRAGYGLDGSTGLDFFNALTPLTRAESANTGGAGVTANSVINLSALTLSDYEIRFSSSTEFSVIDTTTNAVVSTGNAYTSGGNIDFDGIRVVISDVTSAPASGDVFSVSVTSGAASDFAVALAGADADKFAAAKNPLALPGDNSNALDMVDLKDAGVLSNGNATFNGYYTGIVSDIGVASGEASAMSSAEASVVKELEAYRESVSGVSMDEEAANLIKYQHAYQAAARVITVVDTMLDALLNMR